MSTAREILETDYPETWEDRVARAKQIIEETGDLPQAIWYELWFGQNEVPMADAMNQLSDLRPQDAPAYEPWI